VSYDAAQLAGQRPTPRQVAAVPIPVGLQSACKRPFGSAGQGGKR